MPDLVFDHNQIVDDALAILSEKFCREAAFTRNLTGPEFAATDAVAIAWQITGASAHRANLNRELAHISTLAEAGTAPTIGGRPTEVVALGRRLGDQ